MKRFSPFFIVLLLLQLTTGAQVNSYDSVLAKKLNADDYGMKSYVLVILKTGPADITEKTTLDSLFGGHMKNIQRLADQNILAVAGPLGENDKKYEGIFILNADNTEAARKILDTDPAIHSKVLEAELYSLYSSAALQTIAETHKRLMKKHF